MAKNTIKLKKYLDIIEEYVAVAAITPGNLLEITSVGKVRRHATEGGNAVPLFALEDELQGKGIDDNYAAADVVQVWVAQRGEQVYALLEDGEDIVIGDYLMSNGSGRLQKVDKEVISASENVSVVAQALEALDLSGSSGEETTNRIRVMVI